MCYCVVCGVCYREYVRYSVKTLGKTRLRQRPLFIPLEETCKCNGVELQRDARGLSSALCDAGGSVRDAESWSTRLRLVM